MRTVRALDRPHALPAGEVLARLEVDPAKGLSSAEAARRLDAWGRNELPALYRVPPWRRFLAQFQNPLVLLLVAASTVSLGVWWYEGAVHAPYEFLAITGIVIANALLGFAQEERAERAVAALKGMTAATALVVRDGARAVVPAAELVPGDLLVIEEGARIPADARLLHCIVLRTAEAALTGESAPVDKAADAMDPDTVLPDRANMVYCGTTAIHGHGQGVVTATGARAEIGRIAGLIATTASPPTPLQVQLSAVGRTLGFIVVAVALAVAVTVLAMTPVHTVGTYVAVLMFAIALAVAAVPEGLAAVTTVVLSLGMQRMAARNAIVRTLGAVEALGAASVICTDKTGTLTRNEMTVRALVTAGGRVDVTGTGYAPQGELRDRAGARVSGHLRTEATWALSAGYLCNNAALTSAGTVLGDPTEGALKVGALKAGIQPARIEAAYPRIAELPFSAERRLMSTLHRDGEAALLVTKGAPDVVLARCTLERAGGSDRPLSAGRRAEIHAGIERLAAEGLRTLGLGCRTFADGSRPPALNEAESSLAWIGVAGLMDPPRPEAALAVQSARAAGIRVVMITGDHPSTAAAIAGELGIAPRDGPVVSGRDLERMAGDALVQTAARADVYARVSPAHKLAIVHALHARGEVVAMTGDGVNDAPALKAADIGIAMGIAGTDVAKESADIVLADDNFATIVAAIEEGRSIYANIQGFLRFLLASNAGEVLVMFLGVVLAGWVGLTAGAGETLVLPLLATQILWINLVTDSFPAVAVGLNPTDPRLMRRRPRAAGSAVITLRMWYGIAAAALVMAAGTLLLLDAALPGGMIDGEGDVTYGRTMAFNTLVLYQVFFAFCVHSDTEPSLRALLRNRWLWLAAAASLALQVAVIHARPLQQAFGTVALGAGDWLACAAVGFTVVIAREALKAWWRRSERAERAREAGGGEGRA